MRKFHFLPRFISRRNCFRLAASRIHDQEVIFTLLDRLDGWGFFGWLQRVLHDKVLVSIVHNTETCLGESPGYGETKD